MTLAETIGDPATKGRLYGARHLGIVANESVNVSQATQDRGHPCFAQERQPHPMGSDGPDHHAEVVPQRRGENLPTATDAVVGLKEADPRFVGSDLEANEDVRLETVRLLSL